MSAHALEQLIPRLSAIPAEAVRKPDMPIAIFHQEAHDLLAYAEPPQVRDRLIAVGLPPDRLAEARPALEASREAEARWTATYSPRKPEDQTSLEQLGAKLRSDAVAALRWNLRGDRMVQGAVDRIVEGDGVADLIQDLVDLAVLVEQHHGAFEQDQTFDAPAAVGQARQLSSDIRAGLTALRTNPDTQRAVDLRNRAWTHLDDLLTEVREAGRYAYRGTPDAARFGSAYERRRRATTRTTTPQPPDGTPQPE